MGIDDDNGAGTPAGPDDNPEYATVDDILAAHAQFGQMDKAKTKAAMGPNWPPHWDAVPIGPGTIFHSEQSAE